jgi:cytidylate kinase
MDTNNNYVITINRQLGTKGQLIGRELADRLNIRYIDRELLLLAARMLEVDRQVAEKLENRIPSWWDDFRQFCSFVNASATPADYDSTEATVSQLYTVQKELIELIADLQSCVIIGRAAFHVLKDRENTMNLFLHSSLENRINTVANLRNVSKEDAQKQILQSDKQREAYCKNFTGKVWWDSRNYDFTLDVGNMTVSEVVDYIISLKPHFIK